MAARLLGGLGYEIVTARDGMENDVKELMDAGMAGHVPKPYVLAQLSEVVAAALSWRLRC